MRRYLILNPRSGSDSPTAEELRDAAVERGIEVHVLREGEDVSEVARAAEADVLGMAGGDGSLGAVAEVAIDRDVPFVMDLEFEEAKVPSNGRSQALSKTLVNVAIRPQRSRDRRQRDVVERARQLFISLKSYLVAQEQQPDAVVIPTPQQPSEPVAGMLELAQKSDSNWVKND